MRYHSIPLDQIPVFIVFNKKDSNCSYLDNIVEVCFSDSFFDILADISIESAKTPISRIKLIKWITLDFSRPKQSAK